MVAAIMMNGCTNKIKQQEDAEDGTADPGPTISTESVLSAVPDVDELAQYYGQGYEIPESLKNEAALRNGQLWAYLSQMRESRLQDYIEQNKAGYDAFVKNPVAFNGTPAVILRLLPEVMPEVFSDAKFEEATGYFKIDSKDLLPWGFAFTKAPAAPGAAPSPLLVNVTCAACHTGRVKGADGQVKLLVGAPSTVGDINGFRTILSQAIQSPNYTLEKFTAALLAKKDGELYGPDRIMDERIDKAIFLGTAQSPALGAAVLQQFKDGLLKRGAYAAQTAGAFSLKGDLRLLQHSPGHIDFPIAVSLAAVPPAEVLADPAAGLQKYFPKGPGIGDIMSVWDQDKRIFAQWDGNLKNKLTRNLGAELGIAGDARAVNFPNGLATTAFVDKLPAPAYPFKVDLRKASEGRAVYEQACASCHESETFMPVAEIGTEPGRATGLTKDTRLFLITALKAACQDKSLPDCNVPDDEVVVPRVDNPGYISVPLNGIWARAPYLHNGSVPTIYHLLVAEERPTQFQLNDFSYDEKWVGFQWKLQGSETDPADDNPGQNSPAQNHARVVSYDTRIPGYGNAGHADIKVFNGGIDFRKDRRKLDALLEYLKTL
jgi:mono/diheme cytochrome c family protein